MSKIKLLKIKENQSYQTYDIFLEYNERSLMFQFSDSLSSDDLSNFRFIEKKNWIFIGEMYPYEKYDFVAMLNKEMINMDKAKELTLIAYKLFLNFKKLKDSTIYNLNDIDLGLNI